MVTCLPPFLTQEAPRCSTGHLKITDTGGKKSTKSQKTQVLLWTLPLTGCLISYKSLSCSEPQFPHQYRRGTKAMSLSGPLRTP